MDKALLALLVCPSCQSKLHLVDEAELICRACSCAYLIQDEIPMMIPQEAVPLTQAEISQKIKS